MAEALRLADELDDIHTTHVARNAAAELRRLHPYETAYKEWHEKTEWVQTTARPGEFGMHRADVMRQRLEQAEAQRDALLEALKTYGWHTEDCPQHPTYAQPENWPDCTCGFDAAIRARGNVK